MKQRIGSSKSAVKQKNAEEKNSKKVYNEVNRSKSKQVNSRQRVDTLIVKESREWAI
jgi:hypothetical protein